MGIQDRYRKTDEQRRLKEDKEAQERIQRAGLIRDINETFASAHGMRTLRWLMEASGYQIRSVIQDPETLELNFNSTLYNEGRRSIYIGLRKHLRNETLAKVENGGLAQDGEDKINEVFG